MRSSRKPTKSVSICSEPVTENGPCSKKENDEGNQDEEGGGGIGRPNHVNDVHAVAAQVVEDVLRQAPQAARERAAPADSEEDEQAEFSTSPPVTPPEVSQPNQRKQGGRNLQRLPTIQIDTVPSNPPSPTEWPSPPPEASIPEEDEALCEEHIQLGFQEEESEQDVREFAYSYVQDLLDKAVQLTEERRKAEEAEVVRQVAMEAVEDIISRASESAASRVSSPAPARTESLPTIQIDTVASLPSSPGSEEEKGQDASKQEAKVEQTTEVRRNIPEITYTGCEDNKFEEDKEEEEPKDQVSGIPCSAKYKDAPKDMQDFAQGYIKDLVAKALAAAEEKAVQAVPFNFEDVDLMKANGPWYIRAREALMRVLRTACFCAPRRNDS